ncbi:uncharacterized protein [Parasteatoda tepidariorum]|uniref:uncharacterized protein n=1 Tax=Parasteatoda tepidariorum TaxID=114398 RepID=UPI0039BC72C5
MINSPTTLLHSMQKECFNDEEGKKSYLNKNFQIFKDHDDMLRLKSRLANDDETPEFVAPLIIPSKHLVVKRLIEQEHLVNKHAGASILLTIFRERFWIIKGRKTIRSAIKHCFTCKRQRVQNLEVPFPLLPQD